MSMVMATSADVVVRRYHSNSSNKAAHRSLADSVWARFLAASDIIIIYFIITAVRL